jgi:S-adenosylmethionine decarboxylase
MHGVEWVVEAWGCKAEPLRDQRALQLLFESLIADLRLRPVGSAAWHQFPGSGGITGLCLLSESHLACHTFPEHRSLCLNLFCCVPRAEWQFERELQKRFGASEVSVRKLQRSYEVPSVQIVGERVVGE